MSLAPGTAEQAELYVETFGYSACFTVLYVLAIVLNIKVARQLGTAIARLVPRGFGGIQLGETITVWLQNWHDEFRFVRRRITMLFAWAFLFNSFAASCIITLAGTVLRSDGVVSEWQRWAAYGFAFLFTTYAMAQYYAIDTVATWTIIIPIAVFAMGPGCFVSLTARGANGGKAKVVDLSIWGTSFLIILIPAFYFLSTLKIWSRWWRGFPIVLHCAFAMGLWITLWAGPEVAANDNDVTRAVAGWFYFGIVIIWYIFMLLLIYLWKIGPPRQRIHATDAVIYMDFPVPGTGAGTGDEIESPSADSAKPSSSPSTAAHQPSPASKPPQQQQQQQQQTRAAAARGQTQRVVNLDPSSPYYSRPPQATVTTLQPEAIRGRVPRSLQHGLQHIVRNVPGRGSGDVGRSSSVSSTNGRGYPVRRGGGV